MRCNQGFYELNDPEMTNGIIAFRLDLRMGNNTKNESPACFYNEDGVNVGVRVTDSIISITSHHYINRKLLDKIAVQVDKTHHDLQRLDEKRKHLKRF